METGKNSSNFPLWESNPLIQEIPWGRSPGSVSWSSSHSDPGENIPFFPIFSPFSSFLTLPSGVTWILVDF